MGEEEGRVPQDALGAPLPEPLGLFSPWAPRSLCSVPPDIGLCCSVGFCPINADVAGRKPTLEGDLISIPVLHYQLCDLGQVPSPL